MCACLCLTKGTRGPKVGQHPLEYRFPQHSRGETCIVILWWTFPLQLFTAADEFSGYIWTHLLMASSLGCVLKDCFKKINTNTLSSTWSGVKPGLKGLDSVSTPKKNTAARSLVSLMSRMPVRSMIDWLCRCEVCRCVWAHLWSIMRVLLMTIFQMVQTAFEVWWINFSYLVAPY